MAVRPKNPCKNVDGWKNANQAADYYFHQLRDVWVDSKLEYEWWFDKKSLSVRRGFESGSLNRHLNAMRRYVENGTFRYVMVVRGRGVGRVIGGQFKEYKGPNGAMRVLSISRTNGLARRGRNFHSANYINSITHGRKYKSGGGYTPEYNIFKRGRVWFDPGFWHMWRAHFIGDVLNGRAPAIRSETHRQRQYFDARNESEDVKKEIQARMRKELYEFVGKPTQSVCFRKQKRQHRRLLVE